MRGVEGGVVALVLLAEGHLHVAGELLLGVGGDLDNGLVGGGIEVFDSQSREVGGYSYSLRPPSCGNGHELVYDL